MVRATGAVRILEVGTLFGYSGVWMARELPGDGHLDTLELSDVHADAAEAWFAEAGLADRVTVHRGAALDTLARLQGHYDVVFLDAAKTEYVVYAEHAARLLRAGGTMLADNVIWRGRVGDPAVIDDDTEGIRRFHELITGDPRWDSTAVPVGDGVSISVRSG
jgi:predicted O-methyltransferase YrrM